MKTILVDALNTFMIKNQGIFTEMYDLLETYPQRKIIVTNADDKQIIEFGMEKLPYELFTLKHKPDKTNPNYFSVLMRTFALHAHDIVYFEHKSDAVECAQSLGINTFHYDPQIKDLLALKIFLDENL